VRRFRRVDNKIPKGIVRRGLKEGSDFTLTLPFDLIRPENFLQRHVLASKRLALLVAEIFLPVCSGLRYLHLRQHASAGSLK
jgi:hypothetical protein